jgi:hypothetical protein
MCETRNTKPENNENKRNKWWGGEPKAGRKIKLAAPSAIAAPPLPAHCVISLSRLLRCLLSLPRRASLRRSLVRSSTPTSKFLFFFFSGCHASRLPTPQQPLLLIQIREIPMHVLHQKKRNLSPPCSTFDLRSRNTRSLAFVVIAIAVFSFSCSSVSALSLLFTPQFQLTISQPRTRFFVNLTCHDSALASFRRRSRYWLPLVPASSST